MDDGDGKKILSQDLQLVKDLIEYCLQRYMSQKEAIQTLEQNASVEPAITELVWQKLEEENEDFFKAYNFRLKVKNQISMFNQLLHRQVEIMDSICSSSSAPASLSMQQAPYYSASLCNISPPLLQNVRINESAPLSNGRVDLAHCSEAEIFHPINGSGVKVEPTFSGSSDFLFDSYDGFGQETATIGEPLNDLGVFTHIPQNFGFSNSAADLTQRTATMRSFGGSNFLSSEFKGESGENSILDTGSEGVSINGFQSD